MQTHDDLIAFLERLLAAVDLVDKADYGAAEKELDELCPLTQMAGDCAYELDLTISLNTTAWHMLRLSARTCVARRARDPEMHLVWFKVMEALGRLVSLDLARLRKIAAAAGQAA